MTDANKIREQFEAAFIAQQVAAFGEYTRGGAVHRLKRDGEFDKPPTTYDLHRREQGMYDEYWIEMLWWAWQASREAVVVELPKSRADKGETANGDQSLLSALMANHMAIEQCRESILAQGLRVAP